MPRNANENARTHTYTIYVWNFLCGITGSNVHHTLHVHVYVHVKKRALSAKEQNRWKIYTCVWIFLVGSRVAMSITHNIYMFWNGWRVSKIKKRALSQKSKQMIDIYMSHYHICPLYITYTFIYTYMPIRAFWNRQSVSKIKHRVLFRMKYKMLLEIIVFSRDRVAKTHRMPYLCRSFSAKEPYN